MNYCRNPQLARYKEKGNQVVKITQNWRLSGGIGEIQGSQEFYNSDKGAVVMATELSRETNKKPRR